MPLIVQLLPTSAGDRSQNQSLTTFLINDSIAIDAGSLGLALSGDELVKIKNVIITHSHLDHLASLPMAIAEVFPRLTQPLRIHATDVVIKAIKDHVLNGIIWPDFSKIKLLGSDQMSIEFVRIEHEKPFELEGVRFTPVPVNHEVPTIGLIVETATTSVAFTSDTCRTDAIWQHAGRRAHLKAVFVDCSFPDEFEALAIRSGHLTPRLVAAEATKLINPAKIICVHIKPDTREKVLAQLISHRDDRMTPIEIGKRYEF